MSDSPLEPPLPSDWGPQPPPPGLAQKLVARARAVVYESGNSMFDESVLVYVESKFSGMNRFADFEIVDHLGRGLGWTRELPGKQRWALNRSFGVYDGGGTEVLRVKPRQSFAFSAQLGGIAAATVKLEGRNRVTFKSGGESYGHLSGGGWLGFNSSRLNLIDHRGQEVGRLRRVNTGRLLSYRNHYVVSFNPSLRGELRRLAVAAPVIVKLLETHSSN